MLCLAVPSTVRPCRAMQRQLNRQRTMGSRSLKQAWLRGGDVCHRARYSRGLWVCVANAAQRPATEHPFISSRSCLQQLLACSERARQTCLATILTARLIRAMAAPMGGMEVLHHMAEDTGMEDTAAMVVEATGVVVTVVVVAEGVGTWTA